MGAYREVIEVVFDNSTYDSMIMNRHLFDQVFSFMCAFSVGDISEDIPGFARCAVIRRLLPAVEEQTINQYMAEVTISLQTILTKSAQGEPVRIWYSDQPDEMCGFYWLMGCLQRLEEKCGPISAVKFPQNLLGKDGIPINAWAEIYYLDLPCYLGLEQPVTPMFRKVCAEHWKNLKQENAPLRVVLNGHLLSAPATLYDYFIKQEMTRMGNKSCQSIAESVLERYQLGISDQWIAERIDKLCTDVRGCGEKSRAGS